MTKFTKMIEVPMTEEEIAEAKANAATDDHEFVYEFTRACNEYAEKHTVSVFNAARSVVRLDPKLGQRFLHYVFEK